MFFYCEAGRVNREAMMCDHSPAIGRFADYMRQKKE
jgi:hypothetical protein